jgi:hypothetical protein
MKTQTKSELARADRRSMNVFIQFGRFVVLNLRIFMLTKHKH